MNAFARFFSRIEMTPDHWYWRGRRDRTGYGIFDFDGRSVQASRLMYAFAVHPVEGRLRNTCGFSHCVNPTHWEPARRADRVVWSKATQEPRDEAALLRRWDDTFRQAARWLWRRHPWLPMLAEFSDVLSEASVRFLIWSREATDAELEEEGAVYRATHSGLRTWANELSGHRHKLPVLTADDLDGERLAHFEPAQTCYVAPERAVISRAFYSDLAEIVEQLEERYRLAFTSGVDRSGRDINTTAATLGCSLSAVSKWRRTADQHVLAMMRARGWMLGWDQSPHDAAVA